MKNKKRGSKAVRPGRSSPKADKPEEAGALIWRNCAIGALDAETDEKLLAACYVDNGCLDAIRDIASPQSIILGRTGAGKSAAVIRLAQLEPNVISVDPLELAFKHIENSTVIGFFQKAGVNLDLFYRLLWRHVLITELLRAKYNLKDKTASAHWLATEIVDDVEGTETPPVPQGIGHKIDRPTRIDLLAGHQRQRMPVGHTLLATSTTIELHQAVHAPHPLVVPDQAASPNQLEQLVEATLGKALS